MYFNLDGKMIVAKNILFKMFLKGRVDQQFLQTIRHRIHPHKSSLTSSSSMPGSEVEIKTMYKFIILMHEVRKII